MKRTMLLVALLAGSLMTSNAQDVKVIPAYWVVETNVRQKNFSIVRLYDGQNNLVHEVKMDGIYFDVSRMKHRKMLDQLLKGYYPVTTKRNARHNFGKTDTLEVRGNSEFHPLAGAIIVNDDTTMMKN